MGTRCYLRLHVLSRCRSSRNTMSYFDRLKLAARKAGSQATDYAQRAGTQIGAQARNIQAGFR